MRVLQVQAREKRMGINRELQRSILEALLDAYPDGHDELEGLGDWDDCVKNLYYLSELGLITLDADVFMSGVHDVRSAKITAAGIDFLEQDGGASAILKTITVKLHEDTLRQLIEAKVQAFDLPEEEKSGILKALREAPGETTKQLITKLVDLGMESAPKAIPLIQTLLQGGPP